MTRSDPEIRPTSHNGATTMWASFTPSHQWLGPIRPTSHDFSYVRARIAPRRRREGAHARTRAPVHEIYLAHLGRL